MTMHLHHPALSLNGKYKGKKKFRNADQAKKSRELKQSWEELQKKWGIEQEQKKKKRGLSSPPLVLSSSQPYRRNTGPYIPSLNNGRDMGPAFKSPDKVYTGNEMLGVTIIHKSCLQPVFNQQEAIDAAKMRR